MPYLEVRGRRQTGKSTLAIRLHLDAGYVLMAANFALARYLKRRLNEQFNSYTTVHHATTFEKLAQALKGCTQAVVDEAQFIKPAVNTKLWGETIEENLERLADNYNIWLVAMFNEGKR